MFDNPKKELELLEQQLLAAEEPDAENFDDFSDEIYDEIDLEEARAFSRRSAGFDSEDDLYEMDSRRYVPVPRKKGIGGLVFVSFLELLVAAGLIAWWLRRLL